MLTEDVALLRGWLASGEARPGLDVDRDTRWLVVRRLVELGAEGEAAIEREEADRPLVQRTPVGPRRSGHPAGRPTPRARRGSS